MICEKRMKKILLTLSVVFTVMAAAEADAYCCRGGYGGGYGAGWVVGGVVAGAVIGSALAAPYYPPRYYAPAPVYYPPGYYAPAPYYPAPQIVVQQPVVVQAPPPVFVQSQPTNVGVSATTLKPAPAGYRWQIMTNPQTNVSQVVLVPN